MALVQTAWHGRIAELRLTRAPVNALDPALCEAIAAAVGNAATEAHGIVLAGGPGVFSAGLDVPYLVSLGDDRDGLLAAWGAFFDAARALAAAPVPTVAAIEGHAPAGGCVLALCCDYRVMARGASSSYRIGLNETQVGLAVPEGVQALLRRVVGPLRAERWLVPGAMLTVDQALAGGLVDEAVAEGDVIAHAMAWLQALEGLPREPMLATRAIARADVVDALRPERIELERFLAAWQRPDTQAALRAMLKRLGK